MQQITREICCAYRIARASADRGDGVDELDERDRMLGRADRESHAGLGRALLRTLDRCPLCGERRRRGLEEERELNVDGGFVAFTSTWHRRMPRLGAVERDDVHAVVAPNL